MALRRASASWVFRAGGVLLALAGATVLLPGCRGRGGDSEATNLAVTRFMANLVEEEDAVDVYLEAVNEAREPTAPMQIRAVVVDVEGRARGEAVERLGRLAPGERRQASLHVTGCTGPIRLWNVELYPEPIPEPTEPGAAAEPQSSRRE